MIADAGGTYPNPKKAAFLAAYAECGTVRGAVKASKVHADSHYRWLREDPSYVLAFEDAKRRSAAVMEEEARIRAMHGVRRLKFNKHGEPLIDPATGEPYQEMQYSDTLLIFLLKANNPSKFGDRIETTHKGESSPVQIYLPANGRKVTLDASSN